MYVNIKVLTFLVLLWWYKKIRLLRILKQDCKNVYAYLNKIIYLALEKIAHMLKSTMLSIHFLHTLDELNFFVKKQKLFWIPFAHLNMKLELLSNFWYYCPAIKEYIWNSTKRIKKDVDDAIILRVILQFYDREKLCNSRTLSNITITHLLVILVAPSLVLHSIN